jgi:hypothetical protein
MTWWSFANDALKNPLSVSRRQWGRNHTSTHECVHLLRGEPAQSPPDRNPGFTQTQEGSARKPKLRERMGPASCCTTVRLRGHDNLSKVLPNVTAHSHMFTSPR